MLWDLMKIKEKWNLNKFSNSCILFAGKWFEKPALEMFQLFLR